MWGSLAFGYMLVSRTAYVLGIGLALTQQDRHQLYTQRYGALEGYKRFRRLSSILMLNDGTAFVAVCVLTANSMQLPFSRILQVAAGLAIAIVGIGVKAWATARLGANSWYWHNFFVPSDPILPNPPGPYRYFKNPMYGVGYIMTYGFALMCASWPGMIASVFMHLCIMVFNQLVEKPHLQTLRMKAAIRRDSALPDGLEGTASPHIG
jgi:isoprenylcysteine carboxyl methyltransferase (ICMT) family protein YpbQ